MSTQTMSRAEALEVLGLFVSEYKRRLCRSGGDECEICQRGDAALAALSPENIPCSLPGAWALLGLGGSVVFVDQDKGRVENLYSKYAHLGVFAMWLDRPSSHTADAGWWCPTCKANCRPDEVTYEETHDTRAGGCGDDVLPIGATP